MKNVKKRIFEITALTVITLFMSSTVFAQVQDNQRDRQNESQTYPQEQNQRTDDDDFRSQDVDEGVNYSETMQESDLPQEVTSSLDELYPAHEIEEVHRGEDDSYKVKVKNKDDEAVVYYNSEGSFLRARNLNDLQQGASPQQQGQRTRESEWGTDNRTNQQGTQQSQWGTDTENRGTQSGTQQQGTQQGQWGTTQDDSEGSAYPQEQSQRSHDQGEDRSSSDLGTGDRTGTQGTMERDRSATQGQHGTHSEQGTSAQDRNMRDSQTGTQGQYGTTQEDRSMGQDQRTAFPQEQAQRAGEDDVEYNEEIRKNDLPDSITDSLEELYPDHDVKEAYKGEDGSYKVKLEKDDDKVAVYYDSNGQYKKDKKLDKDDRK